MKRKDINNAFKERLATGGPNLSVTWPNIDPQGPVERPFFEVQFPAQNRNGDFISADVTRETGRMAVVIVTEAGTGEDAASDYAEAVSDLFPQALRIPFTGGEITIEQPADIRGGFRDGPDWRVPVIVQYSALAN